jgi:beta-glucosidase
VLLGNYYGLNSQLTTLLEGIVGRMPDHMQLNYRTGSMLALPPRGNWEQSDISPVGIHWDALTADLVIACLGTTPAMEGEQGETIYSAENGDRASISLPAPQAELLKELAKAGVPIILVLTGGSPIALEGLEDLADAILFVWYPGQEGGKAVADVLFGDVTPSGKLPVTFPRSLDQLPPFEDYRMDQRTYRYSTAEPLFPFGFGLSYTRFEYSDLKLAKKRLKPGEPLRLSVRLTNAGLVAGAEVAQVYLSDLAASVPVPQHKLVGFKRVALKPGQSRVVRFNLPAECLMLVDEDGKSRLEPGDFRVTVGGCSPGKRGVELGAPQAVSAIFTVK